MLVFHSVASVLSDNHGRVAMNVVYETYEDYLREKEAYDPETVKITLDPDYYDGEDAESTSNFAEYVRRIRELGFYYG